MDAFEILTRIKTVLAETPGVASCRIGLETGITPDDYPVIRIVPTRLAPSGLDHDVDLDMRQMEVLVYFGARILEAREGLERVYEELLAMESAINAALVDQVQSLDGDVYLRLRYQETLADEDRLPHYKIFAVRWRVDWAA